jgi:hypothetical protein
MRNPLIRKNSQQVRGIINASAITRFVVQEILDSRRQRAAHVSPMVSHCACDLLLLPPIMIKQLRIRCIVIRGALKGHLKGRFMGQITGLPGQMKVQLKGGGDTSNPKTLKH